MNGVPVTDDALAIDLIDRAGSGGQNLQEDHTMNHFRKVCYSNLFERTVYDHRKETGG